MRSFVGPEVTVAERDWRSGCRESNGTARRLSDSRPPTPFTPPQRFWPASRSSGRPTAISCDARNLKLNCSTRCKRVGRASPSLSLPFTGQGETMATALFLGTFVVLLVLSVAANAFFLQLGSRWAKIPNVTFGRLWATVAVAGQRDPDSDLGLRSASAWDGQFSFGLWRRCCAGTDVVDHRENFQDEHVVGVRGLAAHAYSCGMSVRSRAVRCCSICLKRSRRPERDGPAILGRHWESPCPRCGSPAYCTPEDEQWAVEQTRSDDLQQGASLVRSRQPAACGAWRRSVYRKQVPSAATLGRYRVSAGRKTHDHVLHAAGGAAGRNGDDPRRRSMDRRKKQTPPDSCQGNRVSRSNEGWRAPSLGQRGQAGETWPR